MLQITAKVRSAWKSIIHPQQGRHRMLVELIEPRILHSADLSPAQLSDPFAEPVAETRYIDSAGEFTDSVGSDQAQQTSQITIAKLTQLMHELVQSKGWYEKDSKRPQTPRNLAVSLSIEAAEILEHFQFTEEIKDKDELGSELADVTLYLLQLASISGIDLEEAVLKKIEINKTRTWDQNA